MTEHDFGSFEPAGKKFFWKIDYYTPPWSSARRIPLKSPSALA
jgi:hypothetical protein